MSDKEAGEAILDKFHDISTQVFQENNKSHCSSNQVFDSKVF